jgi:hypothetical protein
LSVDAERRSRRRPETDYFTDPVPIRADREAREREERTLRLDRARPRRGLRRPRLRTGAAAVVVVIAAALIAVLGRSPARDTAGHRSTTHRSFDLPSTPVAPKPVTGLAPGVAVAHARPHPPRSTAHRHPAHRSPGGTGVAAEPVPAGHTVTEPGPEPVEADAPTETAPEPGPAPEATSSVTPQRVTEPESSSSNEADRQFGFGR